MDRLRKMEIFVTVVETGQFTRAASTLGLSKSAVSHAIHDLEQYLNFRFIRRDIKGMQLTPAGQDYYEQCCRILADIQEMEAGVRDVPQTLRGSVHITAPITFGAYQIAPILAEFSRLHPDINIIIDLTNRFIDMVAESVDVGIRVSSHKETSVSSQPLTDIEMYMCVSPKFASKHEDVTDLKGLATLNCMKYSGTAAWRLICDGQTHVFAPKGNITSDSGEALREFAIAGRGVVYLPDFLTDKPFAEGNLVPFLPQYKGTRLHAQAVFAPTRHRSKRVRRLVEHIAATFNADDPSSTNKTVK